MAEPRVIEQAPDTSGPTLPDVPFSIEMFRIYQYNTYMMVLDLRTHHGGKPLSTVIRQMIPRPALKPELRSLGRLLKSTLTALKLVRSLETGRLPASHLRRLRFDEIILNLNHLKDLLSNTLVGVPKHPVRDPFPHAVAMGEITQLALQMKEEADRCRQGEEELTEAGRLETLFFSYILVSYDFTSILVTRTHPPSPGDVIIHPELLEADLACREDLLFLLERFERKGPPDGMPARMKASLETGSLIFPDRVYRFLRDFDEFVERGKHCRGPYGIRDMPAWKDEPI